VRREFEWALAILGALSGIAGLIGLLQAQYNFELSEFHRQLFAYYRTAVTALHGWIPELIPASFRRLAIQFLPFLAEPWYLDSVILGLLFSATLIRAGNNLARQSEGEYTSAPVLLAIPLSYSLLWVPFVGSYLTFGVTALLFVKGRRRQEGFYLFKTFLALLAIYIVAIVTFYVTNLVSV
jgi:hypothetical protein